LIDYKTVVVVVVVVVVVDDVDTHSCPSLQIVTCNTHHHTPKTPATTKRTHNTHHHPFLLLMCINILHKSLKLLEFQFMDIIIFIDENEM
jgi:hypothetical protein